MSGSPGNEPARGSRARAFFCAIASKRVGITLRAGGALQGPAGMHVRCDERDCQYVDLNQPPCALNVAMFDDGSERRLATHLQAHAGTRICYACLTAALDMTHDQVRRGSWRFKDEPGVTIRPARCAACGRRGVTMGLVRDGSLASAGGAGIGRPPAMSETVIPLAEDTPVHDGPARIVDFLGRAPGEPFCAPCVALGTEFGLVDTRRLLHELCEAPGFQHGEAACTACARWQHVVWRSAHEARAWIDTRFPER